MNWIERMYDLKGKDFYSQNGEGYYLEYVITHLGLLLEYHERMAVDIGGGDFFYLSNTRHLRQLGWNPWQIQVLDREIGNNVTIENINSIPQYIQLLSIDIDGNDYWIIKKILTRSKPAIIIAEFNAAYTDSRTIKYNSDHIWDGTDYYGFSFDAGVKLAETNGYKVIFQIADMNMIMVREDLIKVPIPPVTFKQSTFFERSKRPETDWVFI